MKRRSVLKSTLLALVGGSLPTAAEQPRSAASRHTKIETRDGTRLHFRDWGTGRPIVLVATWGLCSDWWDAPVIDFVERGWRCVSFARGGRAVSDGSCRGRDFATIS